jgi:hypothetical protein
VPQGSVLAPLFFLLYIRDLNLPDSSRFVMFADDLKIYHIFYPRATSKLVESVEALNVFSLSHQLPISKQKSAILHIGYHNPRRPVQIDNVDIPIVTSSIRDLGIEIASTLSFSYHCRILYSKAYSRAYCILKALKSRDPSLLIKAYTTYVRPILESSGPVFNSLLAKDLHLLERVQKYYTRAVFLRCFSPTFSYQDVPSYAERLNRLGLDSLELRRLKADLILYYKIKHNLTCLASSTFCRVHDSKHWTRRCPSQAFVTSNKSSVRYNSFFVRMSRAFRILHSRVSHVFPQKISVTGFSRRLELEDLISIFDLKIC